MRPAPIRRCSLRGNMRSFVAALVLLTCTWIALPAAAQVTTSNLRGTVVSADDQLPMAEVEVTLIHIPSGNTQSANTNADGAYVFTNLRVGGPYLIRVESIGFQRVELENIFLTAGKTNKKEKSISQTPTIGQQALI